MIGSSVVVRDSTVTRQLIGPRNFWSIRWRCESGKMPVAHITTSTSIVSVFEEPLPPPAATTLPLKSWKDCDFGRNRLVEEKLVLLAVLLRDA
jgi:hypothetical protein